MTLDEFYNLSKDECFERIKAESRSQAKRRLCCGVVFSLLMIAGIVFIVIWKPQEFEYYTNNFYICLLCVFCIAAVWFAVNNLRFFRLVDTLGTPEQLLHKYQKTLSKNHYAFYLFVLGGIASVYPSIMYDYKYSGLNWFLVYWTMEFMVIAFWIYSFFKIDKTITTRRDEEIIDRLEDLIDSK